MKVYVEGRARAYETMFREAGFTIAPLKDAELVCLTGGADVNAIMYGEHNHYTTCFDRGRDEACLRMWKHCQANKIPMVGICRGGQFLNVVNGGRLWQDVNNHAINGTHEATTYLGEVVQVTSTHHQMMRPSPKGDVIMHVRGRSTIRQHMRDGISVSDTGEHEDVEAVFYPETNTLCFQPHPEFANNGDTRRVFFEFVKEFIQGDK